MSARRSESSDRNALSRSSSSASSSHHLSSANPSDSSILKAKSPDPEGSVATSDKASISPPPVSAWKTSFQQMQRRPSYNSGLYPSMSGNKPPTSWPSSERSPRSSPYTKELSSDSTSQPGSTNEQGQQYVPKYINPTSRFSIGSAIMSSSWGSQPSTASSINGSDHSDSKHASSISDQPAESNAQSGAIGNAEGVPESMIRSKSSVSIAASATESAGANSRAEERESMDESASSNLSVPVGPASASTQSVPNTIHLGSRQSRSRAPTSRRMSGINQGASTGTASPSGERSPKVSSDGNLGVIGICALDAKARSKPARNILNRINSRQQFEVIIFGDKVILDEEPENWPLCDYLISFFSEGFPLDKAIAYVRLRKPFTVNDLPMQTVLWDRRICLQILDRFDVPTPKRIEVSRDGGPVAHSLEIAQHIYERTGVQLQTRGRESTVKPTEPPKTIFMADDETLHVDGVELSKPFVEKPVSGEDHNIHIYYAGGGGRRLFRKVNNKSSEADDTLKVPRCVTDKERSYIYEKFLSTENHEDVKAYTVGAEFCHAETRKSPVVDGIVKRNTHGKEVRYVTSLNAHEAEIAAKIAEGFGQRVCGFDLLRVGDKSYVIDVNGWSFVKDNNDYYDRCASILKELFVREKMRKEGKAAYLEGETALENGLPNRPSGSHFSSLKSILRSPSMSRLAGNFHHGPKSSENASPELSSQMAPLISSPSIERAQDARLPARKVPALQPETLPPPATSVPQGSTPLATSQPKEEASDPVPPPATQSQWKLKGMVGVMRHADRTPKQKFKFTFHTKPFVDLLKGHKEEVLLTGEAALHSVQEAAKTAAREGIEDLEKLKNLQMVLAKKGGLAGTKVQIKPMFRTKAQEGKDEEKKEGKKKEKKEEKEEKEIEEKEEKEEKKKQESSPTEFTDPYKGGPLGRRDSRVNDTVTRTDSISEMTLSRAAAAEDNLQLEKLQLIVKWGGEPTHSARYQAAELGENMRNDLLLLNRDALQDLKVFSSSERRVTTSAQIWTAAFLDVTEVPPGYVEIRKDLLDDSNAAKDEMDRVKKKLKGLLRKGNKAPAEFAWPDNMPEPYLVARNVVELMTFHRRVMRDNFAKLEGTASSALNAAAKSSAASGGSSSRSNYTPKDIQPRWCSGEDSALFKERWEKLFDEFQDPEKVDPGKISELHDTIKFDALHNRQFLEWVFTPSAAVLEEFFPSETKSKSSSPDVDETNQKPIPKSESRASIASSVPPEKTGFAHRIGFRKRASVVDPNTLKATASDPSTESYFSLYTADIKSKAKQDVRLEKLRELFLYSKILFDFIGPQEYGITDAEKLEIGLLTSLPLLRAIVNDIEDMQASEGAKTRVYFTKESHIYTLLNCIIEGGIKTKIARNKIPELDYLSTICFELYESQNPTGDNETESFNYSIRITISPGCHTFEPLDVQLDSKHCIGFAQRRSLTAHNNYQQVVETLRAKFHTVKLPKSFIAINVSEKDASAPDDGTEVANGDADDKAAESSQLRTLPEDSLPGLGTDM